uniref:Uncharacterized protein n=1 Tax=Oryza nivara TaxID=4536 RepID=A0A0E0IHB5_ORYNI
MAKEKRILVEKKGGQNPGDFLVARDLQTRGTEHPPHQLGLISDENYMVDWLMIVQIIGGDEERHLLAQLKRDSSGGEAIVLHGISASKHVATINSHSVCIVCLMLAPSIWCIPSHTIVLI